MPCLLLKDHEILIEEIMYRSVGGELSYHLY